MPLNNRDIRKTLAALAHAQTILESGLSPRPPRPPSIVVPVGGSIQAAIDAAPAWSVIAIEPGTYTEYLAVGARPVTLQPTIPVPTGPRNPQWSPVTVTSNAETTITITGAAALVGLTTTNSNPDADVITDLGRGTLLDRVCVLGDPERGQHRGILAHGLGGVYEGLYVDDCGLPGRDAQAIAGWDGTRDLVISHSDLRGAAQSVMFGGADSSSADRIPTGITIEHCRLTKNPDWYGKFDIKTALELKCCKNFAMTDCVLEWSGTSGGQSGYLIVLTPRNQDGGAPWSCIDGVTIERVRCSIGGAGISMLGTDDDNESGPLANVTIRDVGFFDINPAAYMGSGWAVFLNHAPQHVTLERITVQGPSVNCIVYVVDPAVGLTLRDVNVAAAPCEYPYKIDGGGSGLDALRDYMPDAIIEITDADQGAQDLPTEAP
jgi:hypothetical protein